jgi:hypothetical protein
MRLSGSGGRELSCPRRSDPSHRRHPESLFSGIALTAAGSFAPAAVGTSLRPAGRPFRPGRRAALLPTYREAAAWQNAARERPGWIGSSVSSATGTTSSTAQFSCQRARG